MTLNTLGGEKLISNPKFILKYVFDTINSQAN